MEKVGNVKFKVCVLNFSITPVKSCRLHNISSSFLPLVVGYGYRIRSVGSVEVGNFGIGIRWTPGLVIARV